MPHKKEVKNGNTLHTLKNYPLFFKKAVNGVLRVPCPSPAPSIPKNGERKTFRLSRVSFRYNKQTTNSQNTHHV